MELHLRILKVIRDVLVAGCVLLGVTACPGSKGTPQFQSTPQPQVTVTPNDLQQALREATGANETTLAAKKAFEDACPPVPRDSTAGSLCSGRWLAAKDELETARRTCLREVAAYNTLAGRSERKLFAKPFNFPEKLTPQYYDPATTHLMKCGSET